MRRVGPVDCVRCGASISLDQADIVGTGYRCNACTMRAQIDAQNEGVADTSDDLDPVHRAQLARVAKRRTRLGVGLLGLLLAPLAVAVSVTGISLASALVAMVGLYYSGTAIDMIITGRENQRRYGGHALPAAKVRLLPPPTDKTD